MQCTLGTISIFFTYYYYFSLPVHRLLLRLAKNQEEKKHSSSNLPQILLRWCGKLVAEPLVACLSVIAVCCVGITVIPHNIHIALIGRGPLMSDNMHYMMRSTQGRHVEVEASPEENRRKKKNRQPLMMNDIEWWVPIFSFAVPIALSVRSEKQ